MSDDGEHELTSEDKRILKYVADAAREEMPSRRGFIQGGAAAAAIGALGFGTGQATAQADANDNVGDVGTPSDRVDVFSDGADTNHLQGSYPDKVRAISNGGVVASIDPSTTTTPVQDATAAIPTSSAGAVLIPPGGVTEAAPYIPRDYVSVVPAAPMGWGGTNAPEIRFTGVSGGTHGIQVSQRWRYATFGPLRIVNDDGIGSGEGNAINITDTMRQLDMDIRFDEWANDVFYSDSGGVYENRIHRMQVQNCDAGNATALLNFVSAGPQNKIGTINAAVTDSVSGSDSRIIDIDAAGSLSIDNLNIGGTAAEVVRNQEADYLELASVNYEPTNQNTTPTWLVAHTTGFHDPMRIGFVKVNGGAPTADYVYYLSNGNAHLGPVFAPGASTIGSNVVTVESDISRPVIYEGDSGDVDNNSGGTLSHQVSCLGDLSSVS